MIINDKSSTDFKTVYNIDTTIHPDSENVICGNNTIKLGDIRKLYDDIDDSKPVPMMIMYDDMYQYTSLGLLDLLFDMHNIDSNIPIKAFMERSTSGLNFVKSICKVWNITSEEVDYVLKKYYAEILSRSPLSRNAESIIKSRPMASSQLFIFKYYAPGIKECIMDTIKKYGSRNYSDINKPIKFDFLNDTSEYEYYKNLPKIKFDYLKCLFTANAGDAMKAIDERNIDVGANIFTTLKHNGLSNEQLSTIYFNRGLGNGDYMINFIKEGIAL